MQTLKRTSQKLPKRVLTRGNKNSPTQFIEAHLNRVNAKRKYPTFSGYEYAFYGGRKTISKVGIRVPNCDGLSNRVADIMLKGRRGFHTHLVRKVIDILYSPEDLNSFLSAKNQRLHGVIIPDKKGDVMGYLIIKKMKNRKLIQRRRKFKNLLRLINNRKIPDSEVIAASREMQEKFPVVSRTAGIFNEWPQYPYVAEFKAIKDELLTVGIQLRFVANKKQGYIFNGEEFIREGDKSSLT